MSFHPCRGAIEELGKGLRVRAGARCCSRQRARQHRLRSARDNHLDYTTTKVHTPTGLTYDLSIRNPSSSSAAPIPLRKIVLTGPRGYRSDRTVIPQCTASDMDFEVHGDGACPSASAVATGSTVTRPLGGLPFTSQVEAFNTPTGQAMLVKFGNGGSAVVRTVVQGRTAVTAVPTCLTGGQPPSGCPTDEDAVVSSSLSYPAIAVGTRSYATTPRTCPSSRHWKTTISLTYADGVTDTLTTLQLCTPRAKHHHRHPSVGPSGPA